ncbi:MAG: hypothetical protein EOP00_19860 [Pedobacter sp.]|nr:MAG: hypothetical protein EOP00_19860 [Pedobacter sp.]
MKEYISQQSKFALQVIGVYQILGGGVGLLMNIYAFFTQFPIFGIQIVFPFIFFILFTYSIFCGNKCLRFAENALTYSLYNQMFQMLGLSLFGFIFKFVAGFAFNIGFDFGNAIKFTFKVGLPGFGFFYNRDPHVMKIDFNLLAIVLVFCIDRLLKTIKRERQIYFSVNH